MVYAKIGKLLIQGEFLIYDGEGNVTGVEMGPRAVTFFPFIDGIGDYVTAFEARFTEAADGERLQEGLPAGPGEPCSDSGASPTERGAGEGGEDTGAAREDAGDRPQAYDFERWRKRFN